MLYSKLSTELDAMEIDEVGLSFACPEEQSRCEEKAESKITDEQCT